MKTTDEKYLNVIKNNTFYFFNPIFEERYEGYLNSLKEILLYLKNEIENKGLKKEIFEEVLTKKENGLRALLALTGFSNETLKRLMTIIRVVDNPELNRLVYKDRWFNDTVVENIKEWSDEKIEKLIKDNEYFKKGIINIFFE
jgi:hypothetical protein